MPTSQIQLRHVREADEAWHLGPAPARESYLDTGKVLKTYTEFFDPRILGLTSSPALVRRAADNFKIRYAKVREPGGDPNRYAVDHSAGLILLGPDGEFIKKFAFSMPTTEIAAQIGELLNSR